MPALGEEVDGLDFIDGVAVNGEVTDISGEGGGFAGDVDNLGRQGGGEGVEKLAVAAFAGRVDDDEVGVVVLGDPFGQPFFGLGGGETAVGDAVEFGVEISVFDRLGDGFDAVDLAGLTG